MTKICKLALLTMLLLATVFFATACGGESTPYDNNDADGYTVSVRYDANGGFFATSTDLITDSYNISGMTPGSNGMVQIGLLAPEDTKRGSSDTFTATKNGYFLAGWYTDRTENIDAQGNVTYTYGKKWDFSSDVLDVDPSKTYTSSEPVLTLYAAWIPMFEINFVTLGTEQVLSTYSFNPLTVAEIKTPEWDIETGTMEMYRFPTQNGYTFNGAYYDAAGTQPIDGSVTHTGKILDNGTAEGTSMTVYVDWKEGNWYQIYNASQLRKNADPEGNYILMADLDFAEVDWSRTFATCSFSGAIYGNGHTIRNVTFNQEDMAAENCGLFGSLQSSCVIENVTFENVTFTVAKGFNRSANYGLLAGAIYEGAAISGVQIVGSTLQINANARFASDDYAIGLVCGAGKYDLVDSVEITAMLINNDPVKYTIALDEDGNSVVLSAVEG